MQTNRRKKLTQFLEFIPIWLGIILGRLMPFRMRGALFAAAGGFFVPMVPVSRKRVMDGLMRVFPEMEEKEARVLCKRIGRNIGRTMSEILFNASFKQQTELFDAKGIGLDALRKAKAEGKGAIIVSAHFGQWEAIRHYLHASGMETGAVYRENSNPLFERHWLTGIKLGGEPIVAKSPSGNMKMIRHLRKGGFFALLVDQKFQQGHIIPFLGIDALTATSAAELALRYDLPLVPAFGTRDENELNIHVEFEAPIKPSDALTMTRELNDRISARIMDMPEQWYWLHKRWDHVFLYKGHHGDKS
ncbi:MAG: lysophospholipid acyltransferase family protein [Amylibacter sp.]